MRNSHRYSRRVGFEQLEDRRLLANSPILVAAHLFYNNSSFDGSNPVVGASDDAAIATNKSWLLPGQTATFANYSSYDKGINGLSIDMRNLGSLVTGPDLIFKAGTTADPSTWADAPAPQSRCCGMVQVPAVPIDSRSCGPTAHSKTPGCK